MNIRKLRLRTQSVKEKIAEIHNAFNTEVDFLLKEAKKFEDTKNREPKLHDKSSKLKDLGFSSTQEVQADKKNQDNIKKNQKINKEKENMIGAIAHFSYKYPQYKFITRQSIIKICKKYGLIYGDVEYYMGTVPDDKLAEMLNFNIDKEDCNYTCVRTYNTKFSGKEILTGSVKELESDRFGFYKYTPIVEKSLIIAAPTKDFDLSKMTTKDFELVKKPIEVPDPVVMKPVIFKGTEYFLIVTAWGDEAEDDLVKNKRRR